MSLHQEKDGRNVWTDMKVNKSLSTNTLTRFISFYLFALRATVSPSFSTTSHASRASCSAKPYTSLKVEPGDLSVRVGGI